MNKKQVLAGWAITIILLMSFTSITINSPAMAQPIMITTGNASLTGRVFDHGEDTDGDGFFNFLIVDVEVNVSVAGVYKVNVASLVDLNGYYSIYFNSVNETHLNAGLDNVSLSFDGIAIYGSKLNATYVREITLSYSANYTEYITSFITQVQLSQTYFYTMFDNGATLTGKIYDKGVNADGDGGFDFLQIGVEVNVSDEALYQVEVIGLENASESFQNIYNSTEAYLMPGVQTLNVSLYGAMIHASHTTDISNVSSINLDVVENYTIFTIDSRSDVPLTTTYNYIEFETPAYFTGKTFDEGVSTGASPKFDYLRLSFEINVTEAGNYDVFMLSLMDNASNFVFVPNGVSGYYDVGLHLVNISIYGPTIYQSHLNVSFIGAVSLYSFSTLGGPTSQVDYLSKVPLHRVYEYTDFQSDALLTGRISDMGVDTDRDGLFDYLAVGVEINVTKAGMYYVSADGLAEKVAFGYQYLDAFSSVEANFSLGLHTVYLNFSGPMLAQAHFSPTNITGVSLSEGAPYFLELGYVAFAPLSREYGYTLFDAPLSDMHVNFTVYPDGTVGVGGTLNCTHMYPQNAGSLLNASVAISTVGETTTGLTNGTIILPNGGTYGWPYNSTVATFMEHYDGSLLDDRLNATIFMPPAARTGPLAYPTNSSDFSLNSTYSNGLLDAKLHGETKVPSYGSTFPFNVSDLVVRADYAGSELNGNITFRAASGLPLGDVVVYFSGNKTNLDFTGNVTVVYGNYFGTEINSTTVESMLEQLNSTLPGPTGLVYNMTQGMLECTRLNTTITPLVQGGKEYGAEIKYEATIQGNFTGFLAKLLTQMLLSSYTYDYPTIYAALDSTLASVQKASLVLTYYHTFGIASMDLEFTSDVKALWSTAVQLVPPTVPADARTQVEAWLKVANATAYAVKAFSFNASYSSTAQKLDVKGRLLTNVTQLNKDEIAIIPDTVPEQLRGIVKSYLNTTYCNLTSSTVTFNLKNGTGNFMGDWVLKGDFKAQLNYVKEFYINYFNATVPTGFITPQLLVLNETEININNFSAKFKIGKDRMYAAFDGVILKPPKETVDNVRFKLSRFLNVTAGFQEPPTEFEKLGITVVGGSNGTHTVLLYAPPATPTPETSPDQRTMTWGNTTLSSLRELVFEVAYQNAVNYGGKTQPVLIFSNSTVSDFSFKPDAKSISFDVAGASGKGFINVTIPKSLLYAAVGNWTVKIDGKVLKQPENYTVTQNADYVFIYMVYSHSSHMIEIQGTWVVTEFPTGTLLLFLTAATIITAVIMVKRRRRLGTFKLKCESAASMLLDRLRQQRT
jgi:hypothetical protein